MEKMIDSDDSDDADNGRRSKLFDKSNKAKLSDIELNDDKDEKSRSRLQLSREKTNVTANDTANRTESSMSSIIEHYESCIQLSTQNKISVKNAFNLHLIEYFRTLLKKQFRELQDFSTVGTSLDAGVKIYACRVDSVHSDTNKFAENMFQMVYQKRKKQNKEEKEDNNNTDEEEEKRRKKVHVKNKIAKAVLVTDMNQINRKDIGADEPLNNKMKIFNRDSIISSALFDRYTLSLHLDSTVKVCDEAAANNGVNCTKQNNNNKSTYYSVKLPDIPENSVICPTFKNFDFSGEFRIPTVESQNKCTNLNGITFNAEQVCKYSYNFDDDVKDDIVDDYDMSGSLLVPTSKHDSPTRLTKFNNNLKDLLTAGKQSDYFYFNPQLISTWLSSAKTVKHWNPFPNKSSLEHRRNTSKKEKTFDLIDFTNEALLNKTFDNQDDCTLQFSYPNWQKLKLSPPNWDFSMDKFLNNSFRKLIRDHAVNVDNAVINYDYDNLNDSQQFVDDCIEGTNCDPQNTSSDKDFNDVSNTSNDKNSSFVASKFNLSNELEFINVFNENDKPINITELKNELWTAMAGKSTGENKPKNETILFSELYSSVASNDKFKGNNVTVALALTAVLHLANEKRLMLTNTVDGEFKIELSPPPGSE